MKIKMIAVGTKMPSWVSLAFNTYAQRLPSSCCLQLIEIPAAKRSANKKVSSQQIEQWIEKEGTLILKAIERTDHVVALAVNGKAWSTEKLTSQITGWQLMGNDVALLIGGPDGLSKKCLARSQQRWSLSALTLPHPMVRVLLSEAIYRAWSVTVNHPYHRQ